ncbi:hypothetical protein FVEN_g2215 [Fusarium venenatum]|uniref:Uncharacterized protein n=2 Tax=Fusarium venenatum TaxID=56646 RepID=A0A2L2SRU9_9HYPO|nr:uncharacterized protein FVRRES_12641 [Fusarium venenatum]KAG8360449.1 hypothetical protein FVEN_g2215 [Fusarium venenatum]CEI39950.1 unnamed protein product [Fusarium venenatum]
MAIVTTHVTLSCRKREMPSFDGVAGATSNKKRKRTEVSPTEQLNNSQSLAKTSPWSDLPRQATCLILFFFVVAKMSHDTPAPPPPPKLRITKAQKRPQLGYVETTKALAKLDILDSATREILSSINGFTEMAEEIDWILDLGTPGVSQRVTRTKESCQSLIDLIQEKVAFLDQQEM